MKEKTIVRTYVAMMVIGLALLFGGIMRAEAAPRAFACEGRIENGQDRDSSYFKTYGKRTAALVYDCKRGMPWHATKQCRMTLSGYGTMDAVWVVVEESAIPGHSGPRVFSTEGPAPIFFEVQKKLTFSVAGRDSRDVLDQRWFVGYCTEVTSF